MPEVDDHMKRDRFVNRRKMAWKSFYAFSTLGTFLVLLGLWKPLLVQGIWFQAMFVMGLWASVVGAYFGVTYGTDTHDIRSGK